MTIQTEARRWPSGGSEMSARIREYDWAGTCLGSIPGWPPSLRFAVDLILRMSMPAALYWGPTGILIHNDALESLVGGQNAQYLGRSVFDAWPETAAFNTEVLRSCLAGEALVYRDRQFNTIRNGRPDTFWLSVSYSPVLGDDGTPAGVLAVMAETTKQVMAEANLRASEARYRTLADLSPDAIFVNAVDTCTYVNQAGIRLLGAQSADDIVGKPGFAYLDPARLPEARARFDQVIHEKQSHHLAISRWKRADGSFIDVEVSTGPIVWEGKPASQVLARDITKRKRAEEALRESEERFRTLAELVPDLLWLNEPIGKTVWYNQRWLEYTGQSLEEAVDYGWIEAIHPDERDAALNNYQTRVLSGQPIRHERRIRGADGVWRWFLIQALPVQDDRGSIVQWIGAATDVHEERVAREATERAHAQLILAHQAAEQARLEADAAHEYLRNVLAVVPAGIAVMSGREGVFRLVNPAFQRGSDNRPVLGLTYREAYPDFTGQGLFELFEQTLATGQGAHHPELRAIIRRPDGTPVERYFNTTWVPLRDGHGLVSEIVVASVDVTEQVQQRQRIDELRQEADSARAELEEAHRALEERVARRTTQLALTNQRLENEVAERKRVEAARTDLLQRLVTAEEDERRRIAYELHDGVTQLASAAGLHLDELASRLPDLPPDDRFELDRASDLIRRAVAEARRLIAGLRPAVLDDFGLARAIGQEVEMIGKQGWNVHYEDALGPERLPSSIEITLFRVAQEALANVRRHAGPTDVEVRIARRDQEILLTVSDRGRGFVTPVGPPAIERGSHIGLAAIQERITLLGGRFTIESAPGIGTQIRVSVPLSEDS